jgi:predicted Zn-dependent peptidase
MLSAACALVAAFMSSAADDTPRLRTVLPNGATILAERFPEAKTLVVQLWFSARGAEETATTHGRRHLWEHLVARAADKSGAYQLETGGGFLTASTFRDGTRFEVIVPATDPGLALSSLRPLLNQPDASPETLQREHSVLSHESDLRSAEDRLASAAWLMAYGDRGLDPFGDLDALKNVTAVEISELHRRLVNPRGMVLALSGPLGVDEATALGKSFLQPLPDQPLPEYAPRTRAEAGSEPIVAGFARGALVDGVRSNRTLAALCVGLALAASEPNSFFTYTPTARAGLMVLGSKNPKSGLRSAIDGADAAALFNRGRELGRLWLRQQLADPSQAASLRSLLTLSGPGLQPESMLETIGFLTPQQFAEALTLYRTPAAVEVGE